MYFRLLTTVLALLAAGSCATGMRTPSATQLAINGLEAPVEVFVDGMGIAHIYAQNEHDLFFAQGFNVARDRLFQLEWWRRRATGTFAEIAGPEAVPLDTASRLFRIRHDAAEELDMYHPRGGAIVEAFVEGVNAYIAAANEDPANLPIEFQMLNILPQPWTVDIVVSRHNGLYRNAADELVLASAISRFGADRIRQLRFFEPETPSLAPAAGVDFETLNPAQLGLYSDLQRQPPAYASMIAGSASTVAAVSAPPHELAAQPSEGVEGSNAWVLSGARTTSGLPIVASDPHRQITAPSLRYWVHLNAPGWNVIGGGEPALPGISVGHNDHGAWGLTIFSADQEDIYVYETSPDQPDHYKYADGWEPMLIRTETIKVKGAPDQIVTLKYTRHGPVIHEELQTGRVFALRAAWLERGTAPYLGSLAINQATSWDEFKSAAYGHLMPAENLLWADRSGNIGWQTVGIVPRRSTWDGLTPVSGDGRYEWDGFLPPDSLPGALNPASGFIATANENNVPAGDHNVYGGIWAEPFRRQRLDEVLEKTESATVADMLRLQGDELSLQARALMPLLLGVLKSPAMDQYIQPLASWDYRLERSSAAALIYSSWLAKLRRSAAAAVLGSDIGKAPYLLSPRHLLAWMADADSAFGPEGQARANGLMLAAFEETILDLRQKYGDDPANWHYGGPTAHHIVMPHPLGPAVDARTRELLEVGPMPRGGDLDTVNNTWSFGRQLAGASFRMVADLADWDASRGINTPGQSGDPNSEHYRDLVGLWDKGQALPLPFSRGAVQRASRQLLILKPAARD